MKRKIEKLIKLLYFRVFGFEMNINSKAFLVNLSWSFVGTFFAAGVFFAINVLVGRFFGPVEYGRYNLVLAISGVASTFIFFGMDGAAIKFISSTNDKTKHNKYISNFLLSVLLFGFIVLFIGVLARNLISSFAKTDNLLVLIAFFYSFLYAYKILFDNIIKALHKFKLQAYGKIIESLTVLIIFVALIILGAEKKYTTYIYSIVGGSIILAIVYLNNIKDKFVKFDRSAFKETLKYSSLNFYSSIAGIIMGSLDKILIAHFLSPLELGVYSAYLFSSTVVVAQITVAISGVFFPTINKLQNKLEIIKSVDKLMVIVFTPFMVAMSVFSFIILKLFGSKYETNWVLIIIATLVSFFQLYSMFYGNVAMSIEKMFEKYVKIYLLKPIFIVLLYGVIAKFGIFNIQNVLIVLILSCFYDLIAIKILSRINTEKCFYE